VLRQDASTQGARARAATESDRRAALDRLRGTLVAGRNPDGAWGYYTGKSSRLEPTCWSLLALGADGDSQALRDTVSAWFAQTQRPSGALIEQPEWPANIAFNALASFTLLRRPDLASDPMRRQLLAFVLNSKGAAAPQTPNQRQDNSLQGWSWIDATFSWVEPTCWGLLALKQARATEFASVLAPPRINEGERLLIDRGCEPGGWNYGNAMVLGQDLRPYVPTTALGLLAMQDRRGEDVVARALAALEALWPTEVSASALALSLLALDVFDRPLEPLVARLIEHADQALAFGNHHGIASALFALTALGGPHAFRL
jgi:hypothetical protein